MEASQIITTMKRLGITVTARGEQILCRPSSALPPMLAAQVALRKRDLLRLVPQDGPTMPPAPIDPARPTASTWLRDLQVKIRMPFPVAGEDATEEASMARRAVYYRSVWDDTPPTPHLATVAEGTCLVCGRHPVDDRGGFRCALCNSACAQVMAERRQFSPHEQFLADGLASFPGATIDLEADWTAFQDLALWYCPGAEDERLATSFRVLAEIINRLQERGDSIGDARARAVWARLELQTLNETKGT